jgi:transketolase
VRKALAETLQEIARQDPRVMLLTGDLGFMVWESFAAEFPDRFVNVGVAEANMVGIATGLASAGYVPFVYSIATFSSMRCYEQIRNGPVLHDLKVRIIGMGGAFGYGMAGPTHHALEDVALARAQPNLGIVIPADDAQTRSGLLATYDMPGPVYYRLAKRDGYQVPGLDGRFRSGRLEVVQEGSDILFVVAGALSSEVVTAANMLAERGASCTVAVAASLRPAPEQDLRDLARRHRLVVTVEDHYRSGGLGSLVAEILSDEDCYRPRVVRCGVQGLRPDVTGDEAYLLAANGLTSEALVARLAVDLQRAA